MSSRRFRPATVAPSAPEDKNEHALGPASFGRGLPGASSGTTTASLPESATTTATVITPRNKLATGVGRCPEGYAFRLDMAAATYGPPEEPGKCT